MVNATPSPASQAAVAVSTNQETATSKPATSHLELKHALIVYGPKALAVGLTLQGLYGLYASLRFLFIEFPMLEELLTLHQLTQAEVNTFAARAVLTIISTLISMMFALRLTVMKSQAARVINAVVGVMLFLANTFMIGYFNQVNYSEIFAALLR